LIVAGVGGTAWFACCCRGKGWSSKKIRGHHGRYRRAPVSCTHGSETPGKIAESATGIKLLELIWDELKFAKRLAYF